MHMSQRDQDQLLFAIGHQFSLYRKRIDELEARIVQLEARGFKGIYQRALSYKCGQEVTYEGAKWMALVDVPPMTVPGKNNCWQMCDKSHDKSNEPRRPTAGGPRPSSVVERRT